jgi:hypothetical protein
VGLIGQEREKQMVGLERGDFALKRGVARARDDEQINISFTGQKSVYDHQLICWDWYKLVSE